MSPLQISEQRFSKFFATLPEYCYMISPDGNILDINAAALEGLGYEKEELLGKPLSALYAPESHARMRNLIEKWKRNGALHNEEMVILTKQGQKRTVLLNARSVKDANGNVLHSTSVQVDITDRKRLEEQPQEREDRLEGMVASSMDAVIAVDEGQRLVDLTDRQRAELALRESEQRFRLVANTAPVMIWMSGLDRRANYFNQLWLDFTGLSETDLQEGLAGIVHPEDLQKCTDVYCEAFAQQRPFRKECRLRRRDGQYRWMLDIGVPRFHEDGSFAGYIGSCVDITEQKLAAEARATMSQRVIEAQDHERRWLARELHDDIGQRISLLAVNLQSLRQNLPSSRLALRRRLEEEYIRVSELVTDVAALSHHLHSSTLQRKGLATAAAIFCREFSQRQKLQVEFFTDGTLQKIPDAVSLCLFRVLQEALRNAAKHSGTTCFKVSLGTSSDEIVLTVRDEGRGFEPDKAFMETGLGLISMKERLKLVDGHLSIDSKPQSGTTVRASVPFRAQMKATAAIAGAAVVPGQPSP